MFSLSDFEPWWRFGLALVIGALIGLEREFQQQKDDSPDFAGIRTFSLVALLGSVSSFLPNNFGIILAAISLGGLILMTTVSYWGSMVRWNTGIGITTEVAVILTFLFGVMVMGDHASLAIALAVITSLLLTFKGKMHGFIRNMSTSDILITLQFALVGAVILPLLPNRTIDPWGLLNPFQIWLMVVFVSGIGFSGYVLMKLLGTSRGINLMGILGGLASSTATTISFSSASREHSHMSQHYAQAVILASTVLYPRVLFLILVIHPPLTLKVIIPFTLMLITGLVFIFVNQKRMPAETDTIHPQYQITNPLKLSTAIKFGLLFAFVLIVVKYSQELFGSSGVYLASFLTGLTDVDAITLSVTRLAGNAQISYDVAGTSVLVAVLMNTISKGVITYFSGSPELRRTVMKAFISMILIGVISGGIVIYVL